MNEEQKKMIEQLYACAKQCNALCNETDNEPVQILSVRYDFLNQDTTVQVHSGIELISEVLNGQQLMECSDAESGRKWRELNEMLQVVKNLDDTRNMVVDKISGDGWKCKAIMVYDSGNVSIYVDDLDALVKDLGLDSRIVSLGSGRFARYKNINFNQAYVDSDLVAI